MRFLLVPFVLTALFATQTVRADLESMKARVPKVVELKEKGLVGEQPDGLLGVVSANADAQSVVDAENRDRMDEYRKRAKSQGQPVETLMKVLGEAKVRQEKPGRFVKNASGGWTKK